MTHVLKSCDKDRRFVVSRVLKQEEDKTGLSFLKDIELEYF